MAVIEFCFRGKLEGKWILDMILMLAIFRYAHYLRIEMFRNMLF